MKSSILCLGVIVAAMAAPLTAYAQGVPGGLVHGANEGYRIAGPVGAVVGAPVGAVVGGVEGVLGVSPTYSEPPPIARPPVVRTSARKRHHAHFVR